MHAAEAIDDTIALARATRSVSRAMSQSDEAMAVCIDMADVLRPELPGSGLRHSSPVRHAAALGRDHRSHPGRCGPRQEPEQQAVTALHQAERLAPEETRRVRQQHERFTLTRNGEPEAVLLSVDDIEGLEMTLEILGDSESAQRISESLLELGRGDTGVDLATVRADLARRRATGG